MHQIYCLVVLQQLLKYLIITFDAASRKMGTGMELELALGTPWGQHGSKLLHTCSLLQDSGWHQKSSTRVPVLVIRPRFKPFARWLCQRDI